MRVSCEGSWELAAGKEQSWVGSEFPEEQDEREGTNCAVKEAQVSL